MSITNKVFLALACKKIGRYNDMLTFMLEAANVVAEVYRTLPQIEL
jgi:hypothetical protein